MKLLPISILATLVLLGGCQTNHRTVESIATKDGIEVGATKADKTAAAQKRLALGLRYIDKGLMERAKKNLYKAEEHAPDMPDVMFGLGYYYQRVFEYDKAEAYYKKTIQKAPDNAIYLNAYGAFLCQSRKDYDGAVKYFLKAVEQPEYTAVGGSYENAGFCSLDAGNHEKAELYFKKAMTFDPKLSKSLYGLAKMSFAENKYNQAESYLLQFEGKAKPTADSLLLGYKVGRRLNDRYSMDSYGTKLIQLFPDSEQARIYRRMKG